VSFVGLFTVASLDESGVHAPVLESAAVPQSSETNRLNPEAPPSDLAWRVMGLTNLYRLIIAIGLFVAALLPAGREVLAIVRPQHMLLTCTLWIIAGIGLMAMRRLPAIGLRWLVLAHALVDSVAIGFVLWSAGGVSSGLGILLLLPIGAMALLSTNRDAFFMAAVATVALLLQQVAVNTRSGGDANLYITAGVLGLVVFITALSVRPLANRLIESEALVRRQEVDLANLAQLSQYIVQHLRESILVVDEQDRIRLINESAAQVLGDSVAVPGALLGEVSPRLLFLLSGWRQHGHAGRDRSFAAADGSRLIQPHFARLGATQPGPVLVFLEDPGALAEKVQQTKLAALGRLSASIAHEIRNPIGAMSHAGQLLAESPTISTEDRRLTQIIEENAARVSRIIGNVLEMSRRGNFQPERIDLANWLGEFQAEFSATAQLPEGALRVIGPPHAEPNLEVRVDPSQLHQVVWNLCQNAITHGRRADGSVDVVLRYGRLGSNGRPFLEVADRGPGISQEDHERAFEPFFTRAAKGTGLGLFLARELAQTNGATLLLETPAGGGSLFRMVFTDPARWEA
jgi:two-component system sensor histidine kinase PilS (NtrC family)